MHEQDAALHRRLTSRDPSVLADLTTAYGGQMDRLASLILGHLGTAEDAEEIAGDALAAAWQRAAEYDPARTSLKSWLLMLTKYTALDRRRQLQRQRFTVHGAERVVPLDSAPEPVAEGSPEDELLRVDLADQLHRALRRLPTEDRELLIRRYFLEEPIVLLAQEFGMARAAMDKWLWRARQALKAIMNESEGAYHGRSAV